MSECFEYLKAFQVSTIKTHRFRLRKCYFAVLAVKYKQTAFQKTLTWFWTTNSVKYENVMTAWCHKTQHVRLGTLELEKKSRKRGRSFFLFI